MKSDISTSDDEPSRPESTSAEDLRSYPWQDVISKSAEKDCSSYAGALASEADRLKNNGDLKGWNALSFLARVARFSPDYDQPGNPYQPPWRKPLFYSESQLDALEAVFDEITDPEYKARVGDILWEFRRRPNAATAAVTAFIESAHRVEVADLWVPFLERLERAVVLSAKLGRGKPLHVQTCDEVESAINRYKDVTESGFLCARLIRLLGAQKTLEVTHHAQLCRELADRLLAAKKWDQAHEYWSLCAKFSRQIPDEAAARGALLEAAECWVLKAEDKLASEKPSTLFAAHWMGKAFYELQQASAPHERQTEIHQRLRELQKLGTQEMSPMPISVALAKKLNEIEAEAIQAAKEYFRGLSFEDALLKLAFMQPPPDPSEIKSRIESESDHSVWMRITPMATVTETGLTADQIGPMPDSPGPDYDDWMTKSTYLHARRIEWPLLATTIEAAREQINDEHAVSLDDLKTLVTSNSFIPLGHEGIYLRALYAGFVGDWLVCVHLLVPQIEASIRLVFEQHKVRTASMASEGTQQETLLGTLLYHEKMEALFGPELTFNLRGLLVEQFGYNLRNNMAHGFISEPNFQSPAAVILWWLGLHMCWLGSTLISRQNGRLWGE